MENEIFTQEERDELEALRKEKKLGELTKFAEGQLEKYGVPHDFARFLVRDDEENTAEAVRGFAESFGRAKMNFVKSNPAPKDEHIVHNVRRGIKRK